MSQPVHNLCRGLYLCSRRDRGTADHQDRQVQFPRCVNLGSRTCPAGVLGHDQLNGMVLHQSLVRLCRKRAAIHDSATVWQRKRVRLINQSEQISVLWLCREGRKMHAPNRDKDSSGRPGKSRHRCLNLGYHGPAIFWPGLPCRPGQRDQRHIGRCAGYDGVGTHLRGEWMCRVNNMGYGFGPQKLRQPVNATKSANAHRDRLLTRPIHPARIGKQRAQPDLCHTARQRAGLGRAAQDQEMRCHG